MNLPHINLLQNREPLGPDPSRDWLVILGVTLVALLLSVAGNLFFYNEAVAGLPLVGARATMSSPVSADLLVKVQQVFTLRSAEQTKYENGAYSFIDPSK